MTARRGFTLVELLIALVMMVLVAGGIYSLMVTTHRVSRKQTEISNLQGNLRGGLNLVQSELQEIYTDAAVGASDISIICRRPRRSPIWLKKSAPSGRIR